MKVRLHVSFPEELVDRPMLYEMMQGHDVQEAMKAEGLIKAAA